MKQQPQKHDPRFHHRNHDELMADLSQYMPRDPNGASHEGRMDLRYMRYASSHDSQQQPPERK